MAVPSFPFPALKPDTWDVIYSPGVFRGGRASDFPRIQSEQAKTLKAQYFVVEEELARAFQFVAPADSNGETYSVKFAEVIRAAANHFEIISRWLYEEYYHGPYKIDIYNYLALDARVNYSGITVKSYATLDDFPRFPEVHQPFIRLASWDRASLVQHTHVPGWWTAYNKIKHTNKGLKDHATLANAIAAVAGIFVLLNQVYGPGLVSGELVDSQENIHIVPKSTVFFDPV